MLDENLFSETPEIISYALGSTTGNPFTEYTTGDNVYGGQQTRRMNIDGTSWKQCNPIEQRDAGWSLRLGRFCNLWWWICYSPVFPHRTEFVYRRHDRN